MSDAGVPPPRWLGGAGHSGGAAVVVADDVEGTSGEEIPTDLSPRWNEKAGSHGMR